LTLLEKDAPKATLPPTIWNLSSLSSTEIPPLGSLLFNNFLLLDCSAASSERRRQLFPSSRVVPRPHLTFAEFVYGSERIHFSGSHRFEVTREKSKTTDSQDMIRISLSSISCNPVTEQRSVPGFLLVFHAIYARFLFADGIREVMKQ